MTRFFKAPRAWGVCRRVAVLLLVAGCMYSVTGYTQTPDQVDLSISASMTPAYFVSGGRGTFTLTVHNAGPEAAGTTGFGNIDVHSNQYNVTSQPPPFELTSPVVGECFFERAVTEPLPDDSIALIFLVYFGAIPAGESRSCTMGIHFHPFTRMDIPTRRSVDSGPNNDDANPDNDRVEYVFRLRRVPVPGASPLALLLLGLGVLAAGGFALGYRRRRRPVI